MLKQKRLLSIIHISYKNKLSIGKIYICGGFDGTDALYSAEFYDPEINIWTMITPMLHKRSGFGVTNFRNNLYAIGGFNGETRYGASEKYNPNTDSWTKIANLNAPRSNFAIEVI